MLTIGHALIPAAGESRRFVQDGYNLSKPLLQVRHPAVAEGLPLSMLGHVLGTVPGRLKASAGLLGTSYSEQTHAGARVVAIGATAGQADTVLQLVKAVTWHLDPVLVLNCDVMWLSPSLLEDLLNLVTKSGFGFAVLVHEDHRHCCSYVDRVPVPRKFVEKRVISRWALTGAWCFQKASVLQNALESALGDSGNHVDAAGRPREVYLSDALNYISPTCTRYAMRCDRQDFLDWGTPEALLASGAEIVS